jgi:hypothetical protein
MNSRKYFTGIVAALVVSLAANPLTILAQDSTKKLILTEAITAAVNNNKAIRLSKFTTSWFFLHGNEY